MNNRNNYDLFDDKTSLHRLEFVDASLQKIHSAMALLDEVGEDIAVAHLQAGFDVLSATRQQYFLAASEPSRGVSANI